MAVRDVYYPLIITFLTLNISVVGLRLYTRIDTKSLGYDDALMLVALAGFITFGAMEMQAIHYGIGATTLEPQFDMITAAKYFTIAQLVYIITSGITKLAVGAVLLRLTSRSDMLVSRIILMCMMGVVVIFTIVITLVFALQCRPLSVAWGVGTGTCVSTSSIGRAALALSIEDVVTSWFSALFPVYLLRNTTMPLKLKLTVYVLLGFGGVSSIATIVRLKYVVVIQSLSDSRGLSAAKALEESLVATIYSIVEIALSIFAAALAALRPLLRKAGFLTDSFAGGQSGSKTERSYHMNTFGPNVSRSATSGAIKLDDVDSDSQRGIITSIRADSK